jgi:isoquinoline 1-oxidoreductase
MAERDSEIALELEQHDATPMYGPTLARRAFLQTIAGGVVVCLWVRSPAAGRRGGNHFAGPATPKALAAWLHIAEDGSVTVYTGKVEVGQGIRTSLAQQVAEELRVRPASVQMVMGDTDLTPWDMGTFGSRTTPTMGPQLRAVAATARELLVGLAAKRWKADPATLSVIEGKVLDPKTGQSLGYGELTRGEKLLKDVEPDPPLTPPKDWKVAGQSEPRGNGRALVTGEHLYTSDLQRPKMRFGKVLRPAGFHARLVSVDAKEAKALPGVDVVHEGDFVGVVAKDAWQAERALAAIRAHWEVPPQPSNADLFALLKKNAEPEGNGYEHVVGAVRPARESAEIREAQTYTAEHIAHVPLEPRAAVAEWQDGKLTVWTGTQRPFAVREELAKAFHHSPKKVRVIVPDTGSAYGGKHSGEAAVEAARLAKAVGRPVKLIWTREEELTWSYFRPAALIEVQSGMSKDGKLLAWELHNYNAGPSGIRTPYDVPNQSIHYHPTKPILRQGSYRALAATVNHFARESHMDELAHAAGMDPVKLRLQNLSDARLRAALEAAAAEFGWGKHKSTAERGFGVACGVEKGGFVATCAEVEIPRGTRQVRVVRVIEAFECGAIVNPDGVRNQVEGAIVQALGGALFEAVRFDGGRILSAHLAGYRVPRFRDVPEIGVVLLDRKDLPPAGAGETPIVGLAPAVANAIFAATGKRLRHMPLVPDGALP